MITFLQIALSALLAFGCIFILIGALGLVRFSDFFKRLHAPTKDDPVLDPALRNWHNPAPKLPTEQLDAVTSSA